MHNTRAISLTKNLILHSLTKYMKIIHNFLRDHVKKGDIVFEYVDTKNQLVDIFINCYPINPFTKYAGNWES